MPDSKRIFLSHATEDRDIAEAIAQILEDTTLRMARVWFSSDRNAEGGMSSGSMWTEQVVSRLRESTALIALITPRSRDSQWLAYECGFMAARSCQVICLYFDLDPASIGTPLSLYQLYKLDHPSDLSELISRVCQFVSVHYERRIAQPLIDGMLQSLRSIETDQAPAGALGTPEHLRLLQTMIERGFMDLGKKLAGTIPSLDADPSDTPAAGYAIEATLDFAALSRRVEFQIKPGSTLQNVLDDIYFALNSQVRPYTYLQTWVMLRLDGSWPKPLIVRVVQGRIPAHHLIPPGSRWKVTEMLNPYTAGKPLETRSGRILERGGVIR